MIIAIIFTTIFDGLYIVTEGFLAYWTAAEKDKLSSKEEKKSELIFIIRMRAVK